MGCKRLFIEYKPGCTGEIKHSMISSCIEGKEQQSSGSVCTCHVAGPLRSEYRFVKIYFLPINVGDCVSLTVPMITQWRCRLTDFEWDVKEPLRTTRSLAVTTLSVPISKYIPQINAGRRGAVTMARHFGPRSLGYGSWLPRCGAVSLGKTLHLYVHSLNSGDNDHRVGEWFLVCLNSYQRRSGSRAVCSPRSWVGTGMTRCYNKGNNCG